MTAVTRLLTDHIDIWTAADMEKKPGRGRSATGSGSVYGIKKLREFILELAVRGKLVPQDPNDEPADKLLRRIDLERSSLVKEGAIKAEKRFPAVSEADQPFAVPEGWSWARLSQVGHDWGQTTPEAEFTYIEVSAIDSRFGIVSSPEVLEAADAPSRARKIVQPGTVIYATVRPYLLNAAVVEKFEPMPIASTAFAVLHPFCEMPPRYILSYLRSPVFVRYVDSVQTGIAYPAINDKQFFSGLIPLPPLAEQHRIIAKVDELMALCDQLEEQHSDAAEAHEKLVKHLLDTLTRSENAEDFAANWQRIAAHFDTLFTTEASIDALKRTVLELAVMGKLVSQENQVVSPDARIEEVRIAKARIVASRNNKDNRIPPKITYDEIASYPTNWIWVSLDDITTGMDSGWSPACLEAPSNSQDVWGVLKTTSVQVMEYWEHENKQLPEGLVPRPEVEVNAGDVLITRAGPINRVGVSCYVNSTRPKLMISDKIIRFHPVEDVVCGEFLVLSLNAGLTAKYLESAKSGMAASQVNISQGKLRETPIPLPPIAEQHQILAIAKRFVAICDKLKSKLNTANQLQQKLADALVGQAVA